MTTKNRFTDLISLPQSARVWVFQSSKIIDGECELAIRAKLEAFLHEWAAHGQSLLAAYELRFARFIVIGVDENIAMASGCSIDSLMRTMQSIDSQFNLDIFNRLKVAYRSGEDILECDVNSFSAMLQQGKANANTIVFNNLVQSLSELNSSWETNVKNSWHANLMAS